MNTDKCYFSTNIGDILSCCKDGEFDNNGFPINECEEFPCPKYDEFVKDIDERQKFRGFD